MQRVRTTAANKWCLSGITNICLPLLQTNSRSAVRMLFVVFSWNVPSKRKIQCESERKSEGVSMMFPMAVAKRCNRNPKLYSRRIFYMHPYIYSISTDGVKCIEWPEYSNSTSKNAKYYKILDDSRIHCKKLVYLKKRGKKVESWFWFEDWKEEADNL